MQTTTFTIGEKDYEIGPMPIARIKTIWPLVKGQVTRKTKPETMEETVEQGLEDLTTTVKILSVALIKKYPECTAEFIEESLLPTEVDEAATKIHDLLIASGLIPTGPRKPAGEVANPSTAIGTQSSQSSLPSDAKGEAGE